MEELKPTPQTSIVLINRNRTGPLRRTLESLQPLADPKQIEVLVVDNASTDGGATIDSEFSFVSMLRMQRNVGYTKGVNIATRTATGEYLCLTPVGVQFDASTIPALIAALDGESGALAVSPLVFDPEGRMVTRIYLLPKRETLGEFWKSGQLRDSIAIDPSAKEMRAEYVVDSPLLLRRRSIAGMNYLDERYGQFWSDAEICFQVKRAGKSVLVLPEVKVQGEAASPAWTSPMDKEAGQKSADAALGAAGYLAKHQGAMAGAKFRVGAILGSLLSAVGSTLTLQQPGAKWVRFVNLASGQKIDGNQD
jgi:GT2 family glycosyltransferase